MVAIIDTNSHEIHSRPNWSYKGIYPLGAILSHSCIINSRHVIEKDSPYYNTNRATTFIPKGKGLSLITLARFFVTNLFTTQISVRVLLDRLAGINQILLKNYFIHIRLTFKYLVTLYQKTKL